ncbi:MAG: peptidoglycan D,D-transpeptidase FtsI family protein [Candidatus Baltobacteraceae bacterium]
MSTSTLEKLERLFVTMFVILAVRQAYVQIVMRPSIAARPYNPRHALTAAHRGRILASDGTVLAQTVNGTRRYSQGASLAHVVGYVSSRYGTSGLEDAYDRALTPADTTGGFWAQLSDIAQAARGKRSAPRGADVITTIVPAIQNELYAQLSQYSRGAAVVLDPRSGAVLAMTSVPGFDPNALAADFPRLAHAPQSPLLDRALNGLYPPGSTFKIFTASAALESGSVTMQSTFSDPGYYQIGDFTLHDDEGEATGVQDLTGAFALSSNVDFGQIAVRMGGAAFYQYVDRWGIGRPLDFQLPVSRDRVPARSAVLPGELAQMGFGQGALLVTPLRVALLAATIANGGTEPRPYIVREVTPPGAAGTTFGPGELVSPISADTAANVKNMMVAVVKEGTGTAARLPGVIVAGKTGTATNPSGLPHSWFVCFAPANNPRVAVAVIVENAGYGAAVAAPIARNVLNLALKAYRGSSS